MGLKFFFTYEDICTGKGKVKTANPSEFCPGNYDQANLIEALRAKLDAQCPNIVITKLLDDVCALDKKILNSSDIWDTLKSIKRLDSENSDQGKDIDVLYHVGRFEHATESFAKNLSWKDLIDITQKAKDYLNEFFNLSKDVVFSVRNSNLLNSSFRKSAFLDTLMSFGAESKETGSQKKPVNYYRFSFFNPFAYDTIDKTLYAISWLGADTDSKTTLNGLRRSIFFDSVQSAFKRYVYLNGMSHRVNLNRHDSTLTAFPVNDLSSVEEIKPIRLFEKTASYIRNELESSNLHDTLKVNVCIIGHTECSSSKDESGLMDYAAAVLNWYSLVIRKSKPRLELYIRNLVSTRDWPPSNRDGERKNFTCKVRWGDKAEGEFKNENHVAHCDISMIDYESEFGFNTQRIMKEIDENDVVFILDCPWLSTENFEIKQHGSLESFCKELEWRQRSIDLDPQAKNNRMILDPHGFFKYTALREVDSQYNRIMASATTKSGEIVRVMRDSMINRICNYYLKMRSSGGNTAKEKVMYIFTSEKDGINYSFLASYPLTRQEKYDGRFHIIVRFGNAVPDMLQCEDGRVQFFINLWSILKYASISYAYLEFKERLKTALGASGELFQSNNSINYMELLRNIVVEFNVSDGLSKIKARLGFREGIEACIDAMEIKADKESVKRNLFNFASDFIEHLYTDCVFHTSEHYGDDAIKTAFSMNMYSSAQNVQTMLFSHKYQMMYRIGDFSSLNISFDKEYNAVPIAKVDEEFKRDYFCDKKLYDNMLRSLENSADISLGTQNMLYNADVLFKQPSMLAKIIDRIVQACEATGYTNSVIYANARKIQRGI